MLKAFGKAKNIRSPLIGVASRTDIPFFDRQSYISIDDNRGFGYLAHDTPVNVYFSPRGGAQQAIVDVIGQAKATIYVQAYSFTSAPIAKALVDASRRGVKVEALLDKSQRKATYTGATFLKNEGIPVWIDDKHDMALVSLHCGLRAGEIFRLTWGDVDFDRGLLTLKDTKSGRNRVAYMIIFQMLRTNNSRSSSLTS